MEDEQLSQEPSQQFENIDFNTTPDGNDRESSNNEDQEEVIRTSIAWINWLTLTFIYLFLFVDEFGRMTREIHEGISKSIPLKFFFTMWQKNGVFYRKFCWNFSNRELFFDVFHRKFLKWWHNIMNTPSLR